MKKLTVALALVLGSAGGYLLGSLPAFAQFGGSGTLLPNAIVHVSGGSCYTNYTVDGGNASLYCEKPDTSGNFSFTCAADAGASCAMKLGALNLVGDGGPIPDISGRNGVTPTLSQHCEVGEYLISSGTVAAHDAGFARTFATAPTGCLLGVYSGTPVGSTTQNIAATGLSITQGSSSTVSYEFMCCGN